jgi:hypothetical protein
MFHYKLFENFIDVTPYQEFIMQHPQKEKYFNKSNTIIDDLHIQLMDSIGKIFETELLPTYAFFRKYTHGMELKPHRDRESCEFSASLCVDSTVHWPLYFIHHSNPNNDEATPIYTKPGDIILYRGMIARHWRLPLTEHGYQHQLFLHYIDKHGPYADEVGDDKYREYMRQKAVHPT